MEVSRRLGQRLPERHHGLLPAAPAAAVQIDEQPVPDIAPAAGPDEREFLLLSVQARSAPGRGRAISAFAMARSKSIHRNGEAGWNHSTPDRSTRSSAASRRRRRRANALTDLGFVAAALKFPFLDSRPCPRSDARASAYDWFDFLNLEAAELRAQGFEIQCRRRLPPSAGAIAGDFDAAFESSGIDWFELALGIEIDGERRDLAPMLAALVSTPDFTPGPDQELAENGRLFLSAACRRSPCFTCCRSIPATGVGAAWSAAERDFPGWFGKAEAVACGRRAAARGLKTRNSYSAAPTIFVASPVCFIPMDWSDLATAGQAFAPSFGPTRRKAWPGWICCAKAAWAGCWPTTWASARPSDPGAPRDGKGARAISPSRR